MLTGWFNPESDLSIPGLIFRPFRGTEDYPAMVAVINAANVEDGVEEVESVEELANLFNHLANCDPFSDMLFTEVNGQLVGFTRVWWRADLEGGRIYWHLGYLLPAWRRKGIGGAMLDWNESRMRRIAATQAEPRSNQDRFQVFTQDTAYGTNALLKGRGYSTARVFYFMQRKGLEDLPAAPLPAGLVLKPVRQEDLRAIWDAKEDAFRDHWGFTPYSDSDYQRWAEDPNHDLGLWVVAWDGDQVAGTSLNFIYHQDNARYGFLRGEVASVGVRRPWRKRGLGRAMIVESLRLLRAHGMTEAVLGVDSDGQNGALRLYESVGFRTIAQDRIYRKPLELRA